MGMKSWLAAAIAVCFAVGCGGTENNPQPAADSGVADTGRPADAGRDTGTTPPADVPASRAGAACTQDTDCSDDMSLGCDTSVGGGMCTAQCEDAPSQTNEQMQCGGRGSTCLALGDSPPPQGFRLCTNSCRPAGTSVATGGCREGFVCTGWWTSHMDGPDNPGCMPFCSTDAHCAMGQRCNSRFAGQCRMTPPNNMALPDGSPCNPRMTTMVPGEMQPRNTQCRGLCLSLSAMMPTQGICGSFINIRATPACPDDPENTAALRIMDDNMALCLYHRCTTNNDCASPLLCIAQTSGGAICTYPQPGQMGIPGDGGTGTDAATDARPPTDTGTPATDSGTATADATADAAGG